MKAAIGRPSAGPTRRRAARPRTFASRGSASPRTVTDRLGRLHVVTLEAARVDADPPVLGARHRRDGVAFAGSTVNNAARCSMRRGDRPARAGACNLAYGRVTGILLA